IFAVTIPEKRGSLRQFCECLGRHNITEFSYRIAEGSEAHIFVGIQIQNRSDADHLAQTFREQGFKTLDLTDDELTKLHLRHMVGGRPPQTTQSQDQKELLHRFEFPERPGALMKFLGCMNPAWNISLFHYRNHGADYGRIVVGMQVPQSEMEDWQRFLANLGYRYWDESHNPVYQLFLQ
ncbi:MAG: threonine ammonia-lyase, biosynthetic, partial [Prochlorothrix sp.]